MTTHQVKEWNKHFEGAKSRTYSNKSSCQMPTKHGLGYKRIVKRKNGPALFGAWCALIQVLSRHAKPRTGYCTDTGRADGRPYTDSDLEMMTDIPSAIFRELFQVAATQDVDWLRIPDGYHADTTGDDSTIYSDSNSDSDSDSNPKPPDGGAVVLPFDSTAFAEAWGMWTQHRIEKKQKLTPTAIKQQLKAMKAMGEQRAIAALEHSTANGYQGVFEPKAGAMKPKPAADSGLVNTWHDPNPDMTMRNAW